MGFPKFLTQFQCFLGLVLIFWIHMECPCYRCYCCDEKLTKARWGGKVLFDLHLDIIVHY